MQGGAAGVEIEGGPVVEQGKADLVAAAGFGQGVQAVFGPQPLRHGLFDDALAGGHRVERAVQTVAADGELPVPGDEALPGQGADAFKERVEVLRLEFAHEDLHPLAGAQPEIGLRRGLPAAGEENTPGLGPHVFTSHVFQLVRRQPLQPEEAGNGKGHVVGHGMVILSK